MVGISTCSLVPNSRVDFFFFSISRAVVKGFSRGSDFLDRCYNSRPIVTTEI